MAGSAVYTPGMNTHIDYYAFGMLQPGRTFNSSSRNHGFNGKRVDSELYGDGNSYDFGERIYDPRIGRFPTPDPLRATFPAYSPYLFAGNKPIWAIDAHGAGEEYTTPSDDDYGWAVAMTIRSAWDNLVNAFGNVAIHSNPLSYSLTLNLMAAEAGFSSSEGLRVRMVNGNPVLEHDPGAGTQAIEGLMDVVSLASAFTPAKAVGLNTPTLLSARVAGISLITNAAAWAVRSAAQVNKLYKGYYAPFKAGTKVLEYQTKAAEDFVRLSSSKLGNAKGNWLIKKADIEGLNPEQIKDKLSLGYVPDEISEVTVGAGSTLRAGTAAPVKEFGTKGGGTQYNIVKKKNVSFSAPKPLKETTDGN